MKMVRAEITASGRVQGVGFRYFVYRNAEKLNLNGYTQNLANGDVITVVEGGKELIEQLVDIISKGPSHAFVKNTKVAWSNSFNEFSTFEVRY
jgi:acylphosphatase